MKSIVVRKGKGYKVKQLVLGHRKELELHYHKFREEHLIIVHGLARIEMGGFSMIMGVGESLDVPVEVVHTIKNLRKENLVIIEVEHGKKLHEGDFVKL